MSFFQIMQQISTNVSIWIKFWISRIHFRDISLFIAGNIPTGNDFMTNLDEEDALVHKEQLIGWKYAPNKLLTKMLGQSGPPTVMKEQPWSTLPRPQTSSLIIGFKEQF